MSTIFLNDCLVDEKHLFLLTLALMIRVESAHIHSSKVPTKAWTFTQRLLIATIWSEYQIVLGKTVSHLIEEKHFLRPVSQTKINKRGPIINWVVRRYVTYRFQTKLLDKKVHCPLIAPRRFSLKSPSNNMSSYGNVISFYLLIEWTLYTPNYTLIIKK